MVEKNSGVDKDLRTKSVNLLNSIKRRYYVMVILRGIIENDFIYWMHFVCFQSARSQDKMEVGIRPCIIKLFCHAQG